MSYEEKFQGFISMCEDAKREGLKTVVIAYPAVLGDSYDEIIESLSRLADAGLSLSVVGRG